jgi:hypothetical protein
MLFKLLYWPQHAESKSAPSTTANQDTVNKKETRHCAGLVFPMSVSSAINAIGCQILWAGKPL